MSSTAATHIGYSANLVDTRARHLLGIRAVRSPGGFIGTAPTLVDVNCQSLDIVGLAALGDGALLSAKLSASMKAPPHKNLTVTATAFSTHVTHRPRLYALRDFVCLRIAKFVTTL